MENRNFFIDSPEDFRFFLNRSEKEFFVHVIGYHNLCVIPAQKTLRRQDCYTVHFVLAGRGILILEGKRYDVKKNDVFYLDNKSTFSYYPDENDPWEYVFFEFDGEFAEEYIKKTKLSVDYPVVQSDSPEQITSMLLSSFGKEQTSYSGALSVFWQVLDSVTEKEPTAKKPEQSLFLDELKSYIRIKYLDPDFSIENLCRIKFISHSHLCRIFKAQEGMSPVSFVKKMRLDYAASLLKNNDYSLKKIAVMSGFNEYEYFFRSFKKQFGVTPTVYKERLQ